MTYRVVLTGRAEADLDRFLTPSGGVSADTAARLAVRFRRAVARLRTAPLACGLAYENPRFTEEIRHLLFGVSPKRRFRALFVVREDEVVILAIRAPGERPLNRKDLDNPFSS